MISKSGPGEVDGVDLAKVAWLITATVVGALLTSVTDNLSHMLIDLNLNNYSAVLIPIWAGVVDLTSRYFKDNSTNA